MRIVCPTGSFDTEKEPVVFLFENDDELSRFISMLVTTPVKSTGVRIATMLPDNMQLNPLQSALLDVLEGLDGIGGKDTEQITSNAIDKLQNILDKQPKP